MKAWSLSGWILGISEQVKETIGRTVIASDFKVTGSRVCWEESQMSLLKNWAKAGESQVPAPGCQVLSSSWFHSLELLVKWGSERLPRVTHTHAGCAHTWARNTKDAYMHEMCTHAICLLRLMGRESLHLALVRSWLTSLQSSSPDQQHLSSLARGWDRTSPGQ